MTMSDERPDDGDIAERTDEEKLKSLIRKDIDPEVTKLAKRALEKLQNKRGRK